MELFRKHFDDIVQSEEDVQELKKKILELALRGKLVEQNLKDKPASVLIEKIVENREHLVKEKIIRRPKKLPEITDEEKPYELPKGWEWVRLNEVFDVRDGTHDTPKYVKEGIPLVTSKNIYKGKLSLENVKHISPEDHKKISERSKVDIDDILFAMIGSIGNPVQVTEEPRFSIKNVALFKYYNKEFTNPKYLLAFLQYAQNNMREKSSGGVQSFVSLTYLRNYLFPLPPLNEQKRIVGKIRELFRVCDQLLEQIQTKTNISSILNTTVFNRIQDVTNPDQQVDLSFVIKNMESLCYTKEDVKLLRKSLLSLALQGQLIKQDPKDEPTSILIDKVEEEKERLVKEKIIRKPKKLPEITDKERPYELPQSWKWVRLGQITNYGQTDKANEIILTGEEWILELEDIEKESSKILKRLKVKERPFTSAKNEFIKGDVLFGKLRPYLNKVVVADTPGICSTEIMPIRPYSNINPFFIRYVLKSPYFMEYVDSLMAGVKMPRLRTEDGRMSIIPLPPLKEQERISNKLNSLMKLCDKLEQQIISKEILSDQKRKAVLL